MGPGTSGRSQCDAIDRAWRHAQLAPGAERRQNGMHSFLRTEDRVDGAGSDTQSAADASCLVNDGHKERMRLATFRVERFGDAPGQCRKRDDDCIAPRRAAIDVRCAVRYGVGIRSACRKPATRALGLRQHCVNAVGEEGY